MSDSDDADIRRSADADGVYEQADAPCANIGGDQQSISTHVGGHRSRLSTGRRAKVQHARSALRMDERRDQLGGFVLNSEQAFLWESKRVARLDDQASFRPARTSCVNALR